MVGSGDVVLRALGHRSRLRRRSSSPPCARRLTGPEAATAALRVASLLRLRHGRGSSRDTNSNTNSSARPNTMVEEALTAAVGELTRPVDAIKHQAKHPPRDLPQRGRALGVPLVASARPRAACRGSPHELARLRRARPRGPRGRRLHALPDQMQGDVRAAATIAIVNRGGIAVELLAHRVRSCSAQSTRAAQEREVTVACGARWTHV